MISYNIQLLKLTIVCLVVTYSDGMPYQCSDVQSIYKSSSCCSNNSATVDGSRQITRIHYPFTCSTVKWDCDFHREFPFVPQFGIELPELVLSNSGRDRIQNYTLSVEPGVKKIQFEDDFNQAIDFVEFPDSLQYITFGRDFNQPIHLVEFPDQLQHITFGQNFNQPINLVKFPDQLESITFGYHFNQPINIVEFQDQLQHITFGHDFNQPINSVKFPDQLQHITFGHDFNQPINSVKFPDQVQSIKFDRRFKHSVRNVTWPNSLETLHIKSNYGSVFALGDTVGSLSDMEWPNQLRELVLSSSAILNILPCIDHSDVAEQCKTQTDCVCCEPDEEIWHHTNNKYMRQIDACCACTSYRNDPKRDAVALKIGQLPNSLRVLSVSLDNLNNNTLTGTNVQKLAIHDLGNLYNDEDPFTPVFIQVTFNNTELPNQVQDFTLYSSQHIDDTYNWPAQLKSITLGGFDQNIDDFNWPAQVESITLDAFNHYIRDFKWPAQLKSITFSSFNSGIYGVQWPAQLETIDFGNVFNQPIDGVNWPEQLKSINFGKAFNQPINVNWPAQLKSMTFGYSFNQPINDVNWPQQLQSLIFGNQTVNVNVNIQVQYDVRHASLFNQAINNVTWPAHLQHVSFGYSFNQSIVDVNWPTTMRSLAFGEQFSWTNLVARDPTGSFTSYLPNTLHHLSFASQLPDYFPYPEQLRTLKINTPISSFPQQKMQHIEKISIGYSTDASNILMTLSDDRVDEYSHENNYTRKTLNIFEATTMNRKLKSDLDWRACHIHGLCNAMYPSHTAILNLEYADLNAYSPQLDSERRSEEGYGNSAEKNTFDPGKKPVIPEIDPSEAGSLLLIEYTKHSKGCLMFGHCQKNA